MPRGRKKKEEILQALQIQEDVWAQCDGCQKWRRLPPGTVLDEDQPWYCKQNPDARYNKCSLPEEDWKSSGDKEIDSALASELKAEAAKQALKKLAGHDMTIGGGGRGRKRLTDADTGWGAAVQKRSKSAASETPTVVNPPSSSMVSGGAAGSSRAMATPPPPSPSPVTNMSFPSVLEELKALNNGCTRILDNGGTWEPTKPNTPLSQEHIAIPQWFWVGLQHLLPQAAALAACACEVLTAVQYTAADGQTAAQPAQHSSLLNMLPKPPGAAAAAAAAAAAGSAASGASAVQQAEVFIRLALLSAASMLQPVLKLAMQSGDIVAAVAAGTKPAFPQPVQGVASSVSVPPVEAPAGRTVKEELGSAAVVPSAPPRLAPIPTARTSPSASPSPTRAGRGLPPPPPPRTTSPASPPAAVTGGVPTRPSTGAGDNGAGVTSVDTASGDMANGISGHSSRRASGGGIMTGSTFVRPGSSSAGPHSRASSPGTTSTGAADTDPGSCSRRGSREPREPRAPRERQRDPAYERHLKQQQLGSSGTGKSAERDLSRERDRREFEAREREYHHSRERDGLSYGSHPHHHREGREPGERERFNGDLGSPRAQGHGYGSESGASGGREWHDGKERRDSRERERSYERQPPAPSAHYGGFGYTGASGGGGGSSGREHREGHYGHGSTPREYNRGERERDREREHYGHEGEHGRGERDGYFRGGSHYGGGYPGDGHRGRGGSAGPQDWGGRQWEGGYEGGSYGGQYEGGGGAYGSGRQGAPPPPPPPRVGYGDSYGSHHPHYSGGAGQLASPPHRGVRPQRYPPPGRAPPHGSPPPYHGSLRPPHNQQPSSSTASGSYGQGGPPQLPGGQSAVAAAAVVAAAAASKPAPGATGPRPLPLPANLASLPPDVVARLLEEQGMSVQVVRPQGQGTSQQPTTQAGLLPQGKTGYGRNNSGQAMTVAQLRAAAAAAAQHKQQQTSNGGQLYSHGSENTRV